MSDDRSGEHIGPLFASVADADCECRIRFETEPHRTYFVTAVRFRDGQKHSRQTAIPERDLWEMTPDAAREWFLRALSLEGVPGKRASRP